MKPAGSRADDAGDLPTSCQMSRWEDLVDSFYGGDAVGGDSTSAVKPPARIASHSLCCALDNALFQSTGQGLLRFRRPVELPDLEEHINSVLPDSDEPPFPVLSFGVDQGSDNWSLQ
eukprot:16449119-Heterocapsa_arctica.AAC.1